MVKTGQLKKQNKITQMSAREWSHLKWHTVFQNKTSAWFPTNEAKLNYLKE